MKEECIWEHANNDVVLLCQQSDSDAVPLEERSLHCHSDLEGQQSDIWYVGCGSMFEFYDGGPKENHFKYCPYCGKLLTERYV